MIRRRAARVRLQDRKLPPVIFSRLVSSRRVLPVDGVTTFSRFWVNLKTPLENVPTCTPPLPSATRRTTEPRRASIVEPTGIGWWLRSFARLPPGPFTNTVPDDTLPTPVRPA